MNGIHIMIIVLLILLLLLIIIIFNIIRICLAIIIHIKNIIICVNRSRQTLEDPGRVKIQPDLDSGFGEPSVLKRKLE